MGEQEQMTAPEKDELRAGPADPAGGGPPTPAGGGPPGLLGWFRAPGLLGWFRRLSRARRLAITSSAAVIAVVAALLALGATSASPAKPAAAPPPAPGLSLASLGHPGQHISLANYAGKPLVINFFASWCGPCQKETPLIARFYAAAHGRVTVLGVDVNDSATNALTFTHHAGVQYPLVADPAPMTTTLSYGVSVLPVTFFLNARHRIVKSVFGAVTLPELTTGVSMMTKPTGRS
jgi:cytochrome c biogenesis protein CcmG/thiol:disulfide interchange protein DsbE